MVSCKHSEVGRSWKQQIVLHLLSAFPFPGEPVLLRGSGSCASQASTSAGAVCPNCFGQEQIKNAQLFRGLYLILSFPPLTWAARIPILDPVLSSYCWQENSGFSTTIENLCESSSQRRDLHTAFVLLFEQNGH